MRPTFHHLVIFVATITVPLIFAVEVSAHYDARLGRWIERDGAEYVDGMNMYRYGGSRPTQTTDPMALWSVDRTGQSLAAARPDPGDTLRTLATEVGLNLSEVDRWLTVNVGVIFKEGIGVPLDHIHSHVDDEVCPTETVRVPNLVHIDRGNTVGWYVRTRHFYDVFTVLYDMSRALHDGLRDEGYKVILDKSATGAEIRSHLRDGTADRELSAYLFFGHGGQGMINTGGTEENLVKPGRYAHYGLRAMGLFACESLQPQTWRWQGIRPGNRLNVFWRSNVSSAGSLRGYDFGCSVIDARAGVMELPGMDAPGVPVVE